MKCLISLCVNVASALARLTEDASRPTMCVQKKYFPFCPHHIFWIFFMETCLYKCWQRLCLCQLYQVLELCSCSLMSQRDDLPQGGTKSSRGWIHCTTAQLLTLITHVNKPIPASRSLAWLRLDNFLPGGGTQRSDCTLS